ncbi:MAG: pyridoxal phosphate-dependent aminotransferase [Flavobacteriaceae bacterium]
MKNIDRRKWLRTVSLSGGFALLGGFESTALEIPLKPFVKGGPVILSSNENAYGPSQKVREALLKSFDEVCRYPFEMVSDLIQMIAAKEGVSKDCIVVTGGSAEGLRATGLTYGLHGGELIAADPTFDIMLSYAENFGAYAHRVPLNEKMEHDLDAMASRITSRTRLIFICNPNNPTGTLLNKDQLRSFITAVDNKAVVFSDEAYYDFITEPEYPSMVELVKEGRNVIVSKTFSKVFGLAGLRIGYLVARPDIASRLNNSVMAMTNVLAISAAKEALNDDAFYKFSVQKTIEAKELIYNTLNQIGLEYVKSHTNFIFFKTGRHIEGLMKDMLKENIVIGRPFPPYYTWARISTGKIEEVELFGKALKKVMI